jgi:hypothetical protein
LNIELQSLVEFGSSQSAGGQMNKTRLNVLAALVSIWCATAWPSFVVAQDEAAAEEAAPADVPLLSAAELEQLVMPIAFYPDEVLAVTLPAATYPLDIVQAARFLEKQPANPDAQPSADWDPSVLALLNYPAVLDLMNGDLDWTTTLGEAVLNQQADVIDAIQQLRLNAYAQGQLVSDDKVTIIVDADTVEISPTDPKVVYVPIYQPPPRPAHPIAGDQPSVEQPIAEQPAPEPTQPMAEQPAVEPAQPMAEQPTTEITNNNYYPPTYSQPYTPYYNDTANFWTGALLGGVTMGFLMNWDDDDIDIDFDEGDFDNWSPGRGDVNVDGDVNIGNDINIGNGDSWRQLREKRGGDRVSQLPSTRAKAKAAQPVSSLQAKSKVKQKAGVTNKQKKKPVQAGTKEARQKQARQPQVKQSRQKQPKATPMGQMERGRDAVKSSQRGASSQQRVQRQPSLQQQRSPNLKQRSSPSFEKKRSRQSAFGKQGGGQRTKKASQRGGSSRKRR